MKRSFLAVVAAFAFSTVASAAEEQAKSEPSQEPMKRVKLSKEELAKITAGKITEVKVNGGGQTPNGNANGVPSENQNPAGHAPPGQN